MEPDSDQKSRVQRRFSRLFFPRIYLAWNKLNFRYTLKIIYFFSEIFISFVNKTTNQIFKCVLLKRDFYFTNFVKKLKFSEKVGHNFRKNIGEIMGQYSVMMVKLIFHAQFPENMINCETQNGTNIWGWSQINVVLNKLRTLNREYYIISHGVDNVKQIDVFIYC